MIIFITNGSVFFAISAQRVYLTVNFIVIRNFKITSVDLRYKRGNSIFKNTITLERKLVSTVNYPLFINFTRSLVWQNEEL